MARNYAALPHDYLEEMALLDDAEFGRLCRALLLYSRDGEVQSLSGSPGLLWPRVKMQEDRYQASYEEAVEQKRQAGRKSAEARRRAKISADEQRSTPLNGEQHRPTAPNESNKIETETKIETEIIPSPAEKGARAKNAPTFEIVLEFARIRGHPEIAKQFFDYYDAAGWRDAENKPVYNWQQKFIAWEMREKDKPRKNRGAGPYAADGPAVPADPRADLERMEKYRRQLADAATG